MTHPRPQLAIVTGASRGLGRSIARRLAAHGIAVAAVSRTLQPGDGTLQGSLEETIQLVEQQGGRARGYSVDLADPALDRAALVARIEVDFAMDVDVLVNNAAASRRYDTLFDGMTREWFQDSIETNVWNAWDLAIAAIPSMRRRGGGWIVNISSRQSGPRVGPPFAPHPLAGSVLYGGTKAMIDRMTTGAAMELYSDRIAVNSLSPNRGVATAHATAAVPGWPSEPEETVAEATLALVTGDPAVLTGRVAYSLPLLKELGRAVYTADGTALLPGWQPDHLDESGFLADYLRFNPPGEFPAELLNRGAPA